MSGRKEPQGMRPGSPRPSAAPAGSVARWGALEISDRLALPRSLQREDRALRVLAADDATSARHVERSVEDPAASGFHALRRGVDVAGVEIVEPEGRRYCLGLGHHAADDLVSG